MDDLPAPPGKRRRKGNVHKMPPAAVTRLQTLLREGRHTFAEIVAIMQAEFPEQPLSRSGVHRYDKQIRAFTEHMREMETNARLMAEQLGAHAGEDTGALLVNAMMTLVTDSAIKMHASGHAELDDLRTLSMTAKHALQGKQVSLKMRKQIEAETREKVLAEQKAKIEALGKSGQIDQSSLKKVIAAAYAL